MKLRQLFMAMLVSCLFSFACATGIGPSAGGGLTVEEVGKGSGAAKAGLVAADILLAWERRAALSPNPVRARGVFANPFEVARVEIEELPRGPIVMHVLRDGAPVSIELNAGRWEISARPRFSAEDLATYASGKKLIDEKKVDEGVELWRGLALRLNSPSGSIWLLGRGARALGMAKRWDEAQKAWDEGIDLALRSEMSFVAAELWEAKGRSYERVNDYDAAERAHREALTLRLKRDPFNPAAATSLSYLGGIEWARGNLEKAQQHFEKSLEIFRKSAPGSRGEAGSINALGLIAWKRGDLITAQEKFEQVLPVAERLDPKGLDTAVTLNNLGNVARDRTDFEAAQKFHERAIAIREIAAPDSLLVAQSLNNLGNLAEERKDYVEAEALHLRALALKEKHAPDSLTVALSLDNLATVSSNKGDVEAAGAFARRSLAIHEKLSPDSLFVVEGLNILAKLERKRGNTAAGRKLMNRAVAITGRLAPESSDHARVLHALGKLSREENDIPGALDYFKRAVEAIEAQKGKLGGTDDVQSGFAANWVDYYRDYLELLLEVGKNDEAFHLLERSRARRLLAMLAERDLEFGTDLSPELESERKAANREYDRLQTELGRLSPNTDAGKTEKMLASLREIRESQSRIEEKIRKASPRFASLQYPQPLTVAESASLLDPGSLMLAFSMGKEKTFLFVVSSDGRLSVKSISIGADELRTRVGAFRNVIERKGSSVASLGATLFELLLGPVEEEIGRSERVVIIPDGALHQLPFGALVSSRLAVGRHLAEWKPFHTVVSATVYGELKKRRRGTAEKVTVAAFGDPGYLSEGVNGSGGPGRVRSILGIDLVPLPSTRGEVDTIASLFGRSASKYLGSEATEERAKLIGKEVRYIHFATHGINDERFPLNSAIALTLAMGPVAGRENGLLQAWEIFETMRIDADLVTLSACETALGKEMGGEGLIGLTRAFQYAGARSIVASLWSISDESTAELMKAFYGHLKAGQSKDVALQMAQGALVRGGAYAHPFHWAAFQLIGDWQ